MARVQCLYSEYHEPIKIGVPWLWEKWENQARPCTWTVSALWSVKEEWEFEVILGYVMRTSESKTNRQTRWRGAALWSSASRPCHSACACSSLEQFPDCFMQRVLRALEILWLLCDLRNKCWEEHWISPVFPTVFLFYISWLVILFYSFFFSNLTFGNIHCSCDICQDIVEAFLILEINIVWYSSLCFQG